MNCVDTNFTYDTPHYDNPHLNTYMTKILEFY